MFFEPAQSQFDLKFWLFGIHVRVHPGFWLMSLFMGWSAMNEGFAFLLLWVACVFVSILVHEMGHVLVGLLFGSHGHIVLYSFGGLAVGSNQLDGRWKRIAVSFGGPAAGFCLAAVVLAISHFDVIPASGNPQVNELVQDAIWNLLWINIFWGIMNLLPVFPLDGGQISREFWEMGSRRHGFVYCLRLSIAVSAIVAIHAVLKLISARTNGSFAYPLNFLPGGLWTAILFGSLAAGAYQTLVAHQQMNEHWDDQYDEWERDERDRWER